MDIAHVMGRAPFGAAGVRCAVSWRSNRQRRLLHRWAAAMWAAR